MKHYVEKDGISIHLINDNILELQIGDNRLELEEKHMRILLFFLEVTYKYWSDS